MRAVRPSTVIAMSLALAACGDPVMPTPGTQTPATGPLAVSADRAAYRPGQAVRLTIDAAAPADARVRYKHLGTVLDDAPLAGTAWSWAPPAADFQGYMAELYRPLDGRDTILATIGIDVSSDWSRFPRYGFLSRFPAMTDREVEAVIENLNRHHINGLQFYDWHHEHHAMLPGTAERPEPRWPNIFGAEVHLATVAAYIRAAHERNMTAMFYNLVYGALRDAAADGVADEWYLFVDARGGVRDRHPLPPPFLSDIFLLDPGNAGWRDHLLRDVGKVYAALGFDGFHMDQLGDRGPRYAHDGTRVDLAGAFESLIAAKHRENPGRYAVMNAVNQYGQPGIARAPTPFLYTEVWAPHESYAALADLILQNDALADGRKNTVLAAYVNYGLAEREGVFNTPSVLLANAVIFAFGGAHLELGEHMLGREFFPNDNLAMKADLRTELVRYYDFLVAYQNLLRDGGRFEDPALTTTGPLPLSAWPPRLGQVAVVGKRRGDLQVIHLLNFTDATTLAWRDNEGVQPYPRKHERIPVTLATDREVERVWFASPDDAMGASRELDVVRGAGAISFVLPSLRYWSMVVVEHR